MYCANILVGELYIYANSLTILVHLQLLLLCNAYQFKVLLNLLPFGRYLQGVKIPNFRGFERCEGVMICTN